MTAFTFNDLSRLPKPAIVKNYTFEELWQIRKDQFMGRQPLLMDENQQPTILPAQYISDDSGSYYRVEADANRELYYLELESDPIVRILQADVYQEMHLHQRIDEAALAIMPAYAVGSDLEQIAARYGVTRLTIVEATITEQAILESDDALRRRMILSMEARSTAGPEGEYVYHALSADGRVKDAYAHSPNPTEVVVTILSHEGNGQATQELIDIVNDALNEKTTRPMGDRLTVQSAEIIEYELNAELIFYRGPSHAPTLQAVDQAISDYRKQAERIGHSITDSGIKSALHQQGVYRAVVTNPDLPVVVNTQQAAFCSAINITDGGNIDE